MRAATSVLVSLVFGATAVIASPLAGRESSDASTTFRFLGSVYCLVPTQEDVNYGPCSDLANQVPLIYDENGTALTEVLGHSINSTRVPAYGPYGDYRITIDGIMRNPKGSNSPGNVFGPGITRSYDYPL